MRRQTFIGLSSVFGILVSSIGFSTETSTRCGIDLSAICTETQCTLEEGKTTSIDEACEIDFGDRELVIPEKATLSTQMTKGGSYTVNAKSMSVYGTITGNFSFLEFYTDEDITFYSGSALKMKRGGYVTFSTGDDPGSKGGSILVKEGAELIASNKGEDVAELYIYTTNGSIIVDGAIKTNGTELGPEKYADGGFIDIQAQNGNVIINGITQANGKGKEAFGGGIYLYTTKKGNVIVNSKATVEALAAVEKGGQGEIAVLGCHVRLRSPLDARGNVDNKKLETTYGWITVGYRNTFVMEGNATMFAGNTNEKDPEYEPVTQIECSPVAIGVNECKKPVVLPSGKTGGQHISNYIDPYPTYFYDPSFRECEASELDDALKGESGNPTPVPTPTPTPEPPATACRFDSACDDGDSCTVDRCLPFSIGSEGVDAQGCMNVDTGFSLTDATKTTCNLRNIQDALSENISDGSGKTVPFLDKNKKVQKKFKKQIHKLIQATTAAHKVIRPKKGKKKNPDAPYVCNTKAFKKSEKLLAKLTRRVFDSARPDRTLNKKGKKPSWNIQPAERSEEFWSNIAAFESKLADLKTQKCEEAVGKAAFSSQPTRKGRILQETSRRSRR